MLIFDKNTLHYTEPLHQWALGQGALASRGMHHRLSQSRSRGFRPILIGKQVSIHKICRSPARLSPPSNGLLYYRPTDRWTDGLTDQRTDTPSYRVVAHKKRQKKKLQFLFHSCHGSCRSIPIHKRRNSNRKQKVGTIISRLRSKFVCYQSETESFWAFCFLP